MARVKLSYGSFRPMTKGEMTAIGLRGRQYIDNSGTIIPVSQFQRLARATSGLGPQPSKTPKPVKIKQLLPSKVGSPKLQAYNTNVQKFSSRYNISPKEAKSSFEFKYLHKEFMKERRKLYTYQNQKSKIKEGPTSKLDDKILKQRQKLADLAKDLGLKDAQDSTLFGNTPDVT